MPSVEAGAALSFGSWSSFDDLASYLMFVWDDQFSAKAWKSFPHKRTEFMPWDQLPLTSIWSPVIGSIVYLSVLYALPRLRKGQPPLEFPRLLLAHNIFLAAVSMVMFVGLMASIASVVLRNNIWTVWWDQSWILPETSVSLWCYVFYASKYYELLDTLFILLKNKKPRFVQTWHHTSVLFLFWAFGNARMVNHWFLVACNSFVHIFVYGYFALSTMGYTVTWKKYITLMQIGQFVADIAYAIMLPVHMKTGSTNGDYGPFLFGNFIGITFIALFSNVYLNITRASKPTPPAC